MITFANFVTPLKDMGIQHSDMNEPDIMRNYHYTSAISGKTSLRHQGPLKKCSTFSRLDSVGEDSHSELPHLAIKERDLSNIFGLDLVVQDFPNLASGPVKTPLRRPLRPSSSKSLSISLPVQSPSYNLREGRSFTNNHNFYKSRSLSEVSAFPSTSNTRKTTNRPIQSCSLSSSNHSGELFSVRQQLMVGLDSEQCTKMNGLLSAVSGSCTVYDPSTSEGIPHCPLDEKDMASASSGYGYACYISHNELNSKKISNTEDSDSEQSNPQFFQYSHRCGTSSKNYCDNSDKTFPKENSSENIVDAQCEVVNVIKDSETPDPHSDLSSILFSPRKMKKKGRPSSKKQKKRQREKRKSSPNSRTTAPHEPSSNNGCDGDISVNESNRSGSVISSNDICLSPQVSTPVKPHPQLPPVHCLFFAPTSSDSEESDRGEDDDDWSFSEEPVNTCLSPTNGHGFSIALNLDSIFKQKHIPSLQSLLTSENSEDSNSEPGSPAKRGNGSVRVSVSVSLSDIDDPDDSIEFGAASASTDSGSGSCLFLGTVQSLPLTRLSSQGEEASGASVQDDSHSDLYLEDAVDMLEVNSKWDKVYSNRDACSCCGMNHGVASGPDYKVRFVEEPKLFTVYTVGSEDRAGTWHHFALDRERFERRIKETGEIISPVLTPLHRSAVCERNAELMTLHQVT